MEVEFQKENDIAILKIIGTLDAGNADQMKRQFAEYLNQANSFVLDLGQLDTIDSAGLGAVIACLKYASQAGGDLKIAKLKQETGMIFEITRVYRIFDIYDSVDAAVNSFGGITTEIF